MNTVLLTGATGFIGSHIADALTARGVDLRLWVRRRTERVAALVARGVRIVPAAFDRPDAVRAALRDVDTVIHAAAVVSARRKAHYDAVNTDATAVLCRAMHASQRLVYISSQAAAGPSRRDRATVETDAPHPVSDYGRSKLAAEGHVRALAGERGYAYTILRPSVVYGPRDTALEPVWRQIAKGRLPVPVDPHTPLSILYVADLVAAVIASACGCATGATYFVCQDTPVSWASVAAAAAEAMGRPPPRLLRLPAWLAYTAAGAAEAAAWCAARPPVLTRQKIAEMRCAGWVCSSRKLQTTLAWRPRVGLQEGMQRTFRESDNSI